LSQGLVKNDYDGIRNLKALVRKVVIISAILEGIIQIPIVLAILKSYNLTPDIYKMTLEYAIGIMLSMPFSLISAVSVCQLQMAGKMKVLMIFSIIEGVLNIILDLLFVAVLKFGIVGAGFGSAIACIIRSILTMIYLYTKTDIHNYHNVVVKIEDLKKIVMSGLPEATSIMVSAIQSYLIMRILLVAFPGSVGGTIKGVCAFCLSLASVVISSVQGSMRPIISVMTSIGDRAGVRNSMKISFTNMLVTVGLISVFMQRKPEIFYHLHGINDIPEGGILSLRLFATHFVFYSFNTIYRLLYVNNGYAKFSTRLTLIGNLTLPLFAYALYKLFSPPYVWLSYLMTVALIFIINICWHIYIIKNEKNKSDDNAEILYLTIKPENAAEAANDIEEYMIKKGYDKDKANKMSLCIEEMITYTKKSQNRLNIHTQIIMKLDKNDFSIVMLDDGESIKLDENVEKQKLSLNNYDFIKKISKSYEYRYLLNMNYTIIHV
jgi:Na+-driven multidrug efflux pump